MLPRRRPHRTFDVVSFAKALNARQPFPGVIPGGINDTLTLQYQDLLQYPPPPLPYLINSHVALKISSSKTIRTPLALLSFADAINDRLLG